MGKREEMAGRDKESPVRTPLSNTFGCEREQEMWWLLEGRCAVNRDLLVCF